MAYLLFLCDHRSPLHYAIKLQFLQLRFVFHTIIDSMCTVSPVVAIMIKARKTITAYSIPDFRKWSQAGRGEDEGDMIPTSVGKCNKLTDFFTIFRSFLNKIASKID